MIKKKCALLLKGCISHYISSINDSCINNDKQYVNYKACYKSIQKNIIQLNSDYEFDIYIYTYNTDLQYELNTLYNPYKATYQDYDDIKTELEQFKGDRNQISFAYGIFKGIELIESTNIIYDKIIIYRPDILLWKELKLSNYKDNKIYVNGDNNNDNNIDGDFHFVMNMNNANKFKKLIFSTNSGNPAAAHFWINNYVKNYINKELKPDGIIPGIHQEVLRKIYDYSYIHKHITDNNLKEYDLTLDEILAYIGKKNEKKCAFVFFGGSFRDKIHDHNNTIKESAYDLQKKAVDTHLKLIEKFKNDYNYNVDIYVASVYKEYSNDLIKWYGNVKNSIFIDEKHSRCNYLFVKSKEIIIDINQYNVLMYIRLDLVLKDYMINLINPNNITRITFPSICFLTSNSHKTHDNMPRVNDMFIFIPRNYYRIVNDGFELGHDSWLDLVNHFKYNKNDINVLVSTYHDSDSFKDWNPLYYICNRPQNNIWASTGYILNKDTLEPEQSYIKYEEPYVENFYILPCYYYIINSYKNVLFFILCICIFVYLICKKNIN